MLKPPTHRVDATPILILHEDPAWDHELIDKELEDAKAESERRKKAAAESGQKPELLTLGDHPYLQYMAGATRFDLDAVCPFRGESKTASDYLRPDAQPTRFVLGRLGWDEHHRCMDVIKQGSDGYLKGCRYGLREIENCPELRIDTDRAHRSDGELQMLTEFGQRLGMHPPESLPVKIGRAVLVASKPLTVAEKKR